MEVDILPKICAHLPLRIKRVLQGLPGRVVKRGRTRSSLSAFFFRSAIVLRAPRHFGPGCWKNLRTTEFHNEVWTAVLGGFLFPVGGKFQNFLELKYHYVTDYRQLKLNFGIGYGF